MPISSPETPRAAPYRTCRTTSGLKPAERALVRLACAGMRTADASQPGGGSRVVLASELAELRRAAARYRRHIGSAR